MSCSTTRRGGGKEAIMLFHILEYAATQQQMAKERNKTKSSHGVREKRLEETLLKWKRRYLPYFFLLKSLHG